MKTSRVVRRTAVALTAMALWLVVPAVAQAGWEKLSPDDVTTISEPDIGHVSGSAISAVAWPSTPAGDSVPDGVELRTILPTLGHPAGGAGPLAKPVAAWNAVGLSPVFAEYGSGAALSDSHLLFAGFAHAGDGDGGTFLSGPVAADSTEQPYSKAAMERSGDLDAVTVQGSGLLFAANSGGVLSIYRSSGGFASPQPDLQLPLGGCCAYHPSLAVQSNGTPWVAWYSSATTNLGLQMAPLDPATGAPAGPTVKVPGSETVANNFERLPMVCFETCRIFYATQPSAGGPTKLASWAPGDAAPKSISGVTDLSLNGVIGAVAAGDGTATWVAWQDKGGYRATLGGQNGTGGKVVRMPAPSGAVDYGQLLGQNRANSTLLLTAVAGPGGGKPGAVWLEMITPKGDPAVPYTSGFAKPKVLRVANAIAVFSGRQTVSGITRKGLRASLQSSQGGRATLSACAVRPGHPPSPCRSASVNFTQPGFKSVKLPAGPPVRAKRALKVTLKSGGKSKSLTLKLRR
ncbi:MAG: hypothetical protein QOC95_2529 [Thermoleophilaceae bacterium]|nr:hypothetical protein [Thermoleophilaceae bacterium]